MALVNPNSPVGMIRLRIADWSDIPILSDEVIQSALDQNQGNVPRAAKLCAQYVLGSLTSKVHRKMGLQLEVFGAEWYKNYKDFLVLTIMNPNFMEISPIPYNVNGTDLHPLIQFQKDWNLNYASVTQSTVMHWDALGSPNSNDTWSWPQ